MKFRHDGEEYIWNLFKRGYTVSEIAKAMRKRATYGPYLDPKTTSNIRQIIDKLALQVANSPDDESST